MVTWEPNARDLTGGRLRIGCCGENVLNEYPEKVGSDAIDGREVSFGVRRHIFVRLGSSNRGMRLDDFVFRFGAIGPTTG